MPNNHLLCWYKLNDWLLNASVSWKLITLILQMVTIIIIKRLRVSLKSTCFRKLNFVLNLWDYISFGWYFPFTEAVAAFTKNIGWKFMWRIASFAIKTHGYQKCSSKSNVAFVYWKVHEMKKEISTWNKTQTQRCRHFHWTDRKKDHLSVREGSTEWNQE